MMFKPYHSLNKKDEGEGRRESDVTGHDRFCQERPKTRKRRRAVNRRTQSAIELDSEAIASARNVLRRGRSVSIEDEESEEEKGYQLTNKIDNLAKILFSRVSVARGCKDQNDVSRRAAWQNDNDTHTSRNFWCADLICLRRRHARNTSYNLSQSSTNNKEETNVEVDIESSIGIDRNSSESVDDRNGRHQYTALGHTPNASEEVGEYVEMEKRSRDRALSICETYIRATSRYTLIKQLSNVGSRVDKHWFAVRDTSLKTDRLITLVPLSRNCSLSITPTTKDILNNLFLALQHPYVCPVFDLDFLEYEGQNYVFTVQPITQGSLKDLIYSIERNRWNEDWSQKYVTRGKRLPLAQIQQMGRQVLEALIFLKERGFPTVTHLHSGNIVIQNGVARLAGLENTLLGYTSRIHPVVTSRLTQPNAVDIICFGHMLFEMCAGYELCTFKPTSAHLADLEKYPQVIELMELIFEDPDNRYPSVEDLLVHDLFRNIDLREMRCAPVTLFRPTLTPSIMNLLDGIKRQNVSKRITSLDSDDMISLKSPRAEYEDSLLVQIYNELSNTTI